MKNTELPNDIDYLKEALIKQQELNLSLQAQIAQLLQRLEQLQRLMFGQKSEKKRNKPDEETPNPENQPIHKPAKTTPSNERANGRGKLPENLTREVVKLELPEAERSCHLCLSKLHCMGKEVSEQLEYVPAQLIIKEFRRYKYGCTVCRGCVKTAPMPAQPIEKGLAGPGLLAEVLVSKYQDCLPLYRQEQRWKRLGHAIPRSTQCDWVAQCAFLLKPLVERMKEKGLMISPKIHTDDTTFPVLALNKTHTGRMWTYIGGGGLAPACAIYTYSKNRSKENPKRFLKSYQGYLQADAYAGYDCLYLNFPIIEVACWAHARRKFVDVTLLVKEPTAADDALEFIGQLYEIERRIKLLQPDAKKWIRKKKAKPILKKIHRWLIQKRQQILPNMALQKAIDYVLNHWRALCNYCRDGVLSIDNNAAERAIKPIVLGRKNYLFAGSHAGAENAAIIYSIIETCKLNSVNTFEYLRDVLKKLPSTLYKDIDSLLPYNWQKTL